MGTAHAGLGDDDQQELLDALVERLRAEGAGEGMLLVELMQVERNLADALRLIRRQIDELVKKANPSDVL